MIQEKTAESNKITQKQRTYSTPSYALLIFWWDFIILSRYSL